MPRIDYQDFIFLHASDVTKCVVSLTETSHPNYQLRRH